MRYTSLITGLGAATLAFAAHAQAPELATVTPEAEDRSAPIAAQSDALPGPDGVIHRWGPPAPIVQAAPLPAQNYPPCSRTLQDSCYNPDPSKEADTKAAWKSQG